MTSRTPSPANSTAGQAARSRQRSASASESGPPAARPGPGPGPGGLQWRRRRQRLAATVTAFPALPDAGAAEVSSRQQPLPGRWALAGCSSLKFQRLLGRNCGRGGGRRRRTRWRPGLRRFTGSHGPGSHRVAEAWETRDLDAGGVGPGLAAALMLDSILSVVSGIFHD